MTVLKKISQYSLVIAMIVVALLGIPLIFPGKNNPYKGKSVSNNASLEVRG